MLGELGVDTGRTSASDGPTPLLEEFKSLDVCAYHPENRKVRQDGNRGSSYGINQPFACLAQRAESLLFPPAMDYHLHRSPCSCRSPLVKILGLRECFLT